ncbi:MAG: alpha/beta hydrolase-fold protein [Chitinophagaceae bacterium]
MRVALFLLAALISILPSAAQGGAKPPFNSTASQNVSIIDTAFYIPQLNRKRRVLVYLPENYTTSGNYRYPVLYMHDGQNVFDAATSFAGEWGVDEFLDTAFIKTCIVVAVDNGSDKRMNEYCPYDFTLNPNNPKGNKGEGKQYVDFLVKTLKPFIDKKYRTLKDSRNTFIAGASMGGLISLYAVLKYPKVFGGAGVFSPSVWICKEELLQLIKTTGRKVKSNIYFYCGKQEGPGMVPDMLKAFEALAKVSKSKIKVVIRDDGKHNEPTWRKEFPCGYVWMLYGAEPVKIETMHSGGMKIEGCFR